MEKVFQETSLKKIQNIWPSLLRKKYLNQDILLKKLRNSYGKETAPVSPISNIRLCHEANPFHDLQAFSIERD